jgi:molybdopterin synthase catalytic subunit
MITIKLFAAFAEYAGMRELSVPYADPMTCNDVWKIIAEKFPKLADIPPLFAIGDEYVPAETPINDGDQLLLFPPVSGGSPKYIFETPLSIERAIDSVVDDEAGGIATFIGRVRRQNEGKIIRHLHYECHVPMAEKMIHQIVEEMFSRWALKKVAIEHRIGKLEVGDLAVVIAVSAEHRREALEACRYCIDELKHRVPIWKKEVSESGEEWIGACTHDHE